MRISIELERCIIANQEHHVLRTFDIKLQFTENYSNVSGNIHKNKRINFVCSKIFWPKSNDFCS